MTFRQFKQDFEVLLYLEQNDPELLWQFMKGTINVVSFMDNEGKVLHVREEVQFGSPMWEMGANELRGICWDVERGEP